MYAYNVSTLLWMCLNVSPHVRILLFEEKERYCSWIFKESHTVRYTLPSRKNKYQNQNEKIF